MRLLSLLATLWIATSVAAPSPVAPLAEPPHDAQRFTILSTAGKHGDLWIWTTADGNHWARESYHLRGWVFDSDSTARFDADGMLEHLTVRGVAAGDDASESFDVSGHKATWKSPVDHGSANYAAPAMYAAYGGPVVLNAYLAERLLASPDHTLSPASRRAYARAELLRGGDGRSGIPSRRTVTSLRNHRIVDHTDADVARCERPLLRLHRVPGVGV